MLVELSGLWTALVTPFAPGALALDLPAFHQLCLSQSQAGVRGVVVAGSTGEFPALSFAEKIVLFQAAVSALAGSGVLVYASTGLSSTAETCALSVAAAEIGVDGLMVVSPYYNRPTPEGLRRHFWKVADSVGLPIMLYDSPGRSGVSLSPELIVQLAAHPQITALKDAQGNLHHLDAVIGALRERFGPAPPLCVLAGDDATLLPARALGVQGLVSVASHLIAADLHELLRCTQSGGNWDQARALHGKYRNFYRDLFVETNPVPIKYALCRQGRCAPDVRPPLAELSLSAQRQWHTTLQSLHLVSA